MTEPTTRALTRPHIAARPDSFTGLDTVCPPDTPTAVSATTGLNTRTRIGATGRVDCVLVRPAPAASMTGHPHDAVVTSAAIRGLRTVFEALRERLVTGGVVWLEVAEPASAPGADVTGLGWRMALAVQHDGWILRNAITCTPDPASAVGVSTVFLLTRQRRYYFALPARADAAPAVAGARAVAAWPAPACRTDGRRRPGVPAVRQRRTALRPWQATGCPDGPRPIAMPGAGAGAVEMNPGDLWRFPAEQPHPTDTDLDWPPCRCAPTHPGELIEGLVGAPGGDRRSVTIAARAILLGCPPGGVVHDPLDWCGHGPVARAAAHLGRRFQPATPPSGAQPTHVETGVARVELADGSSR